VRRERHDETLASRSLPEAPELFDQGDVTPVQPVEGPDRHDGAAERGRIEAFETVERSHRDQARPEPSFAA